MSLSFPLCLDRSCDCRCLLLFVVLSPVAIAPRLLVVVGDEETACDVYFSYVVPVVPPVHVEPQVGRHHSRLDTMLDKVLTLQTAAIRGVLKVDKGQQTVARPRREFILGDSWLRPRTTVEPPLAVVLAHPDQIPGGLLVHRSTGGGETGNDFPRRVHDVPLWSCGV